MAFINVLIVEDDPLVANLLRNGLAGEKDYRVVAIAENGEAAWNIIETQAIDLLLLDVHMPKMKGSELLQKMRGAGKRQGVIMITAASDVETIRQLMALGITDYIVKTSFGIERLQAALAKFRKQKKLFDQHENLGQNEIDLLLQAGDGQAAAELPKGMVKMTLNHIWTATEKYADGQFVTEELAEKLDISKVSVRKYLEFLVTVGALEKDLIYVKIGRPIFSYRRAKGSNNVIARWV
ncbi:MAG: response regulator [Negativicutes bacterium]|jgi:CitB family two-component system response regulator MalR